MTGRPLLVELAKRIDEAGGDHVVLDRIADGVTMRVIAESYGVSRRMIYDWIHAGGDEREKGWELARKNLPLVHPPHVAHRWGTLTRSKSRLPARTSDQSWIGGAI